MDALSLAGFGTVFVLLTILSTHRYQSLLAPAPMWNLCWAGLFLVTALLGTEFTYVSGHVFALALLAILFNVPGFLLNSHVVRQPLTGPESDAVTPRNWMLLVGLGVGVVGAIRLSAELGKSLLSLRTVDELFSFGQENAIAIFRGEANISLLVTLSFAALQVATALGGVRTALRPTRAALLIVAMMLATGLLWSSITTQRSYLLVVITWFAGGYIAASVWRGRTSLPRRALIVGGILGGLTLVLIVLLRAIRTNGADAGLTEETLAPTRLWLAGYIPTFSAFMEQAEPSGLSFGMLSGVSALLEPIFGGSSSNDGGENGMYYIGAGLFSNAATSMTRIIGSGGLVWGGLSILLLGLLCHIVYTEAARGGIIAAAVYVGVVTIIIWSVNAWFLGYGRRVMALLVLVGIAALASRLYRKRTVESSLNLFVPAAGGLVKHR